MKRSKRLTELGTDAELWMRQFTKEIYVHASSHPTPEDTENFTRAWFEDAIRAGRHAERALLQQSKESEN